MTHAPRSPERSVGWRATCALLVPGAGAGVGAAANVDGAPKLYELEEALLRRGVDILRCRGVHDAMAEALLHERRRRAGDARDPFIIVFVEPGRVPEASALVDAAATHAPHAVFWQYTKDPSPRLTAWTPAVAAAEVLAPEPKPRPSRYPSAASAVVPPTLRLAGKDDEDEPCETPAASSLSDTAEVHVHAPAASELTEEELTMLLAPEEQAPPRPRG